MARSLKLLSQRWWFWPALIFLALAVLTKGQILLASLPALRFLLPLAVIYGLYRYAKYRFVRALNESLQRQRQAYRRQDFASERSPLTIEICGVCGAPKTSSCRGHVTQGRS